MDRVELNNICSNHLWKHYVKDQKIEIDYFGKNEHRGYFVRLNVRGYMDNHDLVQNYFHWCEKQLANVT